MARPLKISIKETEAELELRLTHEKMARNQERIQMLFWLKKEKVSSRKELGQLLGHHESTITRWLNLYRKGGLSKLLEIKKAQGQPPKIQGEVLEGLKARLNQEKGFQSYGEIQEWLKKEYQIEVNYKTVHKTVRYQLKAKLKTPRPSSIKQNKKQADNFKKN